MHKSQVECTSLIHNRHSKGNSWWEYCIYLIHTFFLSYPSTSQQSLPTLQNSKLIISISSWFAYCTLGTFLFSLQSHTYNPSARFNRRVNHQRRGINPNGSSILAPPKQIPSHRPQPNRQKNQGKNIKSRDPSCWFIVAREQTLA